jgi:hypothetical protein
MFTAAFEEGAMRPSRRVVAAALMAAGWVSGVGATPSAQATDDPSAINGRYVATSDGTYATTNYAFHNEATVTSTWTITSICATEVSCTGQVSSDQGWSAPLRTEGHVWYAERDVPNWETCPDGTSFTGHQTFMFYPANANGVTQIGSPYLEGKDKTVGQRFACGAAKEARVLTIVMPFHLDKVG